MNGETRTAPETSKKALPVASEDNGDGGDVKSVAPAPSSSPKGNSQDLATLRGRIFDGGVKTLKREVIDLFGTLIEIRQPTIDQVNRLSNLKAGENPLVHVMIEFCYMPGTDIKIFTSGDKEQILNLPAGEWVTRVNEAIAKMTGVDIKEAEKNLGETV